MVKFGVPDVPAAMKLGEEAAREVTKLFPRPVQLEFEKVYCPYLLMNKKRYAGLYWSRPDRHDKLDAKGIETVRRDNCLLVRRVVGTCLKKILEERDVAGAVEYTKSVIADLLQNKLDISLLVITKVCVWGVGWGSRSDPPCVAPRRRWARRTTRPSSRTWSSRGGCGSATPGVRR